MNVKLLTEPNLEFLSFKGGCTSLSESALVKMPHCWKSHVTAQISLQVFGAIVGDDWLAVPGREDGTGGVDVSTLLVRIP